MNAPQPRNWPSVKQMRGNTKTRIQATLSRLSVEKGTARLVLSKYARVYVARQHSDTGVKHPLVEIVRNGSGVTVVLWEGEVYV